MNAVETLGNTIEIKALLDILKETGIKGVLEYSDVIVLSHLIERGHVGHSRNQIIETLRDNTNMSYGQIMELVQRYENFKNHLPSYSLALNNKLDKLNAMNEAVIPFTPVGQRLIGVVKDGRGGYFVYDGNGNHLIEIAKITERYEVIWNEHWVIHPSVNQYIAKQVRNLKQRIW